jgi:hypothetical protein
MIACRPRATRSKERVRLLAEVRFRETREIFEIAGLCVLCTDQKDSKTPRFSTGVVDAALAGEAQFVDLYVGGKAADLSSD